MSKAVVGNFQFTVIARTREECIELMDNTAFAIIEHLGGAPWTAVDDDVKRLHNPQATIADDQGFLYQGQKSCHFSGPYLDNGAQTFHDMFKPQHQVVE